MKKLITIMSMVVGSAIVHGQGFVIVQSTAANIQTNTSSFYAQNTGSFTTGKTSVAANSFYYALLFATTTPAGVSGPANPGWTVVTQNGGAALAMNNYVVGGAISGTGTSGGVAVNMAAGTTYSVELVGWSANLGTSFTGLNGIQSQLISGNWAANGFFGHTAVGSMTPFATAGAGDPSIFPATFANGSLVLFATPTPEPGTMALAALGGASLLLFRRKK